MEGEIINNFLPTAADGSVQATEDTAYPFAADDFNFSDLDSNDVAFAFNALDHVTIITLPKEGTLALNGVPVKAGDEVTKQSLDDEDLTYTPPANVNGVDIASFTFKVNDGKDDSELAYSMNINVTAVNDAPIPMDDDAETPENTPVEIKVLANDEDVDEGTALSVTRVGTADGDPATETNPANGTVTITGSGTTIAYTPDSNFVTGTDTFTYVVSDNATPPLTAVGTVRVTVISDASNARLRGLTMSTGTLEPDFSASTTSYTASVANDVASLTVTPTTERTGATVKVDDILVISGSASTDIPLAEGADTTISVVVTPQDLNAEKRTYSIEVTRAPSANAALSNLQLRSEGTLEPLFDADTTSYTESVSYTASVANDVASVTLTAAATNDNARLTLTVNDEEVESTGSSANRNIPLREGETTRISIKVTAQDGETTQTYSIEVSRAPSDNAALSYLQLSEGTLAPLFAPHITSYSASVANAVASLTVTPSTSNDNATVTVNGNEVIRGSASDAIPLALGNTPISVVVTAQDGTTTQSYSITVTRAAADASDVATLSTLSLSPGTLNETFVSSTTSYTANVLNSVASVTLTAAATNDNARLTLTVNDEEVESSSSNSANRNIPLREGETTRISIKVTAQDGETTQTYSIEVSRAPSDNAALSYLQLSEGTLAPLFAPHITSYSASVANAVASLTVTPSTSNDNATVTVNGNEVIRGSASDAIPLALGNTPISVVVTAQDGTTTQSYSITVTRAAADASDVATLSTLSLSPGTLNETFVSSTTSYTANVLNSVASVTLTAAATNDNARLTLTVNDEEVESTGSNSANRNIPLREGETTRISIRVTAQDGETTQTYSIEVSRAPSDNAALSYLQLSEGTLAPLFAPHITSYTAAVANAVASLTVTPSTSNDNATVTVNGNEVSSDSASDPISLAEGADTPISVVVTAQDGTTTQSYSITVTRAAADASDVATLSTLSLSPGTLNETFVSSTTSYTANVLNSVASVTLTAAATNDNARLTLTVNDEEVESTGSSANRNIPLREGETTRISIRVTAEDGTTTQTYSIEVSRAPSDNAALSYLQLSEGTLAPLFDPHITSYTAAVANDVTSLTVTPSTSNDNATVTVNGNEVTSDSASDPISLAEGADTPISVVVTAQDGTTTQSYSITVTRAAADASDVATLETLSLSPGTLNETFVSSTTSYTANVLNSVASVTLTAAATNDNARLTLTVNDEEVESTGSNSANRNIPLREGETTRISIRVTAQDGETTQTYSIEVSRAPSDNAALSYLQLSEGTLAPLFAPHITSYSASVANAVASLTVMPSTSNDNATVTVNGNEVTSDSASDPISLDVGNNTIPVVVTAQDGTTTQSYSITVTRAAADASNVATLSALSLSPGTLNETFASSTTSYTASVANDVASVTLTAAATNDNARLTLTVNEEDVESSSSNTANRNIPLREGETTRISIRVTAQDGETTQTYSIEVSRAPSANAALSYLQLSEGTLAPLFAPHITSYSASVANAVASLTVMPSTSNDNATVTVNGNEVTSDSASDPISLDVGNNTIPVVVTAQDGTTTQSYSITVTRAAADASNVATLSALSLSPGTLNETFASSTTSYTASVANDVASVTLTAAATNDNARLTLTVNEEDVESSSSNTANRNIPLREGETTRISIRVTAQDGETTQTYSIEVSRAPSANAALSYLQLSEGTLAPLFDPHITSYTASVANDVTSLTVTPSTSNDNATVTVNGNEVSSDSASDPISLAEGADTPISVVVTAQDGTTTQSYSITVTRAAADASDVATLSALSLSPGTLNETFASSTTSYTASVANDVASVTLTAAATNDNARLTLTVNEEDVESSSSNTANRNIPLREGETTRISIRVTAEDGTTTQTYSIEVSRAPSDNAALSYLQLSEGTLAPLFDPHITSYSASVANDVASLTVTPSTSNDNATVTVNGNEVTSDSASDPISLDVGNNTIPVVVTAQDGTTTQSYSITVTRAAADASDVATLSTLSLSPGTLNETFVSSTTSYTANVLNSVASVTLTAAATNDNARLTLTVNDEEVESTGSNSANRNIPLREGETTRISIRVTAQDGETTQTYSIEVSRAPSDNAALSYLQLSEGTLAPLFDPHITSYTAAVANDVASLTVTPSTSNDNATVTVNGNEVTSDSASDPISLDVGNNTIPVVVTAQDGTTTQSYSITVTRAAADASNVATLSALSLSPGTLNETFASSTTSYTASVANDVASVTLTAAATNDNARLTLTVNEEDVESSSSNTANRNIPLREGETTRISIRVTAQDGETTQTYSIEVSRAPSANAALSYLQLSEGTLAPLFDPHITSYSASVANAVASLTVMPSTSNDNATVTVNGNEVTSDSASDPISLDVGNNTIPVVVTAQDGTTTQSYSITVTRAAADASNVATLSALSLSPGTLNETFASSTTSYTASVANDVASVTLTAAATNDNARLTLTVNEEDVESSSSNTANRNIPLREGETTRISIRVTAQDGETTQTYSIEVSRAPSANAALSYLQLSEGTLAPLFDPHITSYSASVANAVASLTVMPSTSNDNATVTVNGNEVTSDSASDPISLDVGNNTIPVVVTAQDGTTTQSYSITVTRAAADASNVATLSALSLSPGTLNETFASSTTSYTASVANDVASVTLTAAATNDNARLTLTVNEEDVESSSSNTANRNIPLREGETTRISIRVTAQDGETTQTYSIEVSRAPSANAALSYLQLSEGTLAPLFDPHITSYTASVANDVTSLTVTPSTSNDNATVTVNGNEVTSDSASDPISLAEGADTPISVVVTAQDGTTTQSYSITVTRAAADASDVATLSALSLSPGTLNETFASSTTSYTASVANDVASVTLTAAATNDNARLTLTVNEEDVESSSSNSANRNIPLREGETTRISIRVTAEDGTTTQTYSIEVSRAPSDNAALSDLQLSAGTLAPLFAPHITSYSAAVANDVTSLTVTPSTSNDNATVTVNGNEVSSDSASDPISLAEGADTPISVVVTAQDGTTTQSYSITVTRAAADASDVATLSTLSLSPGTLNETFVSSTTSYTANVLNSVASVTLTAAATNDNARLTLTVNDEEVESTGSNSANRNIPLREGETTRISIRVTAQDGETTQTYSIEVSRAPSDNAALSYLQLSEGTLAPLFDPHITSYTAAVANAVASLTVTPSTSNDNATVTVNGNEVTSDSASDPISLDVGNNTIPVVVTAQDGTTTQSYSITVTRAAADASNVATLSALSLSPGTLNETFASSTTSYTASVANDVASVTLTAAATNDNARLTLTVNEEDVESSSSNTANRNIPLREGETTRISIRVTAQDGETTQTYSIEVSRAPSANAALSYLQLSEGTLAPLFDPHITSYSTSVANAVASLTVMPSTSNDNATVTVNGNEVTSDSASDPISLDVGNNTIPVVVTAQDGTTTQSYSITVTRAAADASNVATLSALSLSPGTLNETFASSTTSYTASVANDVASVTLTAAATNDNARLTLTVNEEDVESSSSNTANRNIPLREGETTRISIRVTAQDGETTQTYSIEVSRAPSANAALSYLQLSEGTLAPLFAPHITSYTASVANDVTSLTVTPSTSNDNATVTVNGNEVSSDSASDPISLDVGNNTIPVVVTAQDGTTTQSYSITVTRAAADASNVATLSALSLSPGTLNETFASSTTSYTASVANDVASVTLTAAATNDNARLTLTVNEEDVESSSSNTANRNIPLREGETTRISIRVTAQDGETTQTYSIEVSRAPSANAALSYLQLSEGTLAPLFDPHITSYSASVANAVASLTVMPSTSNDNATVTVNGNEVTSDSASDPISLDVGNNTIPVVVTAQDGTTTQSYSITVTRAAADASNVATLSALSLSPGTLNETFVSSTTSYTANVLNSVASVTLTAAATNDNARLTLTVNDEEVESTGSNSANRNIPLREGETTRISIRVTAQDGETTQTYSIEVSRAPSDNAALSYLQLSAGTLAPLFDPHITSYTAAVANDVASLTVTPSTSNDNATVTVNGNEVTSDSASDPISLAEGADTPISVVVTAQDGTTTQSYSITVTRAAADASDVATLSTLSLSPGTLNETFVSSTTSYTANVLNSVASVTLTAAATNDNARLTLTVNDEEVESTGSNSANRNIPLREGETTRISIRVTAEDGTTTQTYSIEVSRAPSDNAALSYLQLSEGTLAPLFDPHITSYTAAVANDVASLTVTPSTSNDNATVTVNGNEVSSDSASDPISLAEGADTPISVVVTAQDGTTTQSYSITVTRAAADASDVATLSTLSLSPGTLNETFVSSTTSYTANVLNSVASVTLTAAATNDNARLTLTVNDEEVESTGSNSANRNIPLREGETTRISIRVTAEDGTTTQTYSIEVSRAPSDNAALSYLQLSAGTLAPLFAPHITSYSAAVANDVTSLTVTPSTSNDNATVTVNGNEVSSDSASDPISLAEGADTPISVVVTAQDGTTTQSYSITVTRAAADASDVATLSTLSLSPGTLNETFVSSTTSYTANVLNSVASVTLTAAATNDNARLTLTVNDEEVESTGSNSANRNIPLREGETTRISIRVTAEDGTTTQTYSIEVSRAPSDNAALSDLQLSAGTLAPLFAPHITSYSAAVANDVTSLTVTPSTSNDNATVTVNGNEVSSDSASDPISLDVGNNTIPVVVTAQDGTTTQSYSITVTRAAADASDVATLSALSLSPESAGTLEPDFSSSTTSYSASVANDVASVTLTAAATNDNARLTLTVNEEDVESSSSNTANRNIPLREGETTRISIRVTAQDGETTQTYSIEVSRAPSANAALSYLQLSEGTLAPLFAPHITSYSAAVANAVASLTVTPSTSNDNATVTVNGKSASTGITLVEGENSISVVVTAQDGETTQTYSITVTRVAVDASDVATLSALSLSPESAGTLEPDFSSSTTSYSASVANDVASVTLTAAATDNNARLTLTVDDEEVESSSSNTANRNIPLREGETTRISIRVTAQDGTTTQTYSIEVSRAPSDNAALSDLQLSAGTLAPLFAPHITSYSAAVANAVASLTVTPSTSNDNATVTVNGKSASTGITLVEGENSISVVVTAQDGETTQTYSITVTRAAADASDVATLSALSLSPESAGTLEPDFSSSTTSYSASVANDVASVTLTAAATDNNARLTLTVDDEEVESSSSNTANRNIPLREGETTRISIRVTAQDGTTTQTYSIEVSRAPSDNAALSYLQLSAGTLAPLFAPHITSYSASVANAVASLTVTPSTSNDNATVTVNGKSASTGITLVEGENSISVVVTAQDGETTQTYSITVTRVAVDASDVATLSALSLSPESAGTLEPDFSSSTTSYSASVANDVASVTLTAAATDNNARLTLTVNEEDVESSSSNTANRNIPLREGETTRISIRVTAQDGTTTQTYSIEVSRAPSDNAALSYLQLSAGTLAPLFAPHITSYSAAVANDVTSLTVTPSTSNDNATVTVNGKSASTGITLVEGENSISVVVTAQDGETTQTYSITVTRVAVDASDVATLSALSLSPESAGTLEPDFSSSTTSYSASVANDVASVTLTAAATDNNARLTLTVDDEEVESSSSNSANRNIPLREGGITTITIRVTAQDGTTTQTYSIEVSRAPSDNAALSYLQLSAGTLAPLFAPHITSYSAAVANAVASLTVTPSTSNDNATVTVNGNEVTSDSASDPISLDVGNNTIPVVVTAQDGETTQTYSITVTRVAVDASDVATLSALSLSPESAGTLEPDFSSSTTSYSASVANDVASVTLTAAATDNNARLTLTVDDEEVESSSSNTANRNIPLREGGITTITIRVTAEDGTTTQTYSIEVSRAPSDNAALSHLQLSAGTLAPLFAPHITSYSAAVANAVASLTVTPSTSNDNATVTVNGKSASTGITLVEGENSISVVVTAQDGETTQTYSITVTRAAADASDVATLSALSLSPESAGTLEPDFSSSTTSYSASVANDVASVTLTAAATDNNARLTLTVDDEEVESSSSNTANRNIPLREGGITTITIRVTAEDGTTTQTYSIEVTRAASDNAALSDLQLSAGTLAPLFAPHITIYTAPVANAVASLTVTPSTSNDNATVTVNGNEVTSDNPSYAIPLAEGSNTPISVVVTAQDGETTQTYSITVLRPPSTTGDDGTALASSDATLSTLSLSPESLNETFASSTTSYTASVANDVASVTLTAAATNNKARLLLTVDDKDVESTSSSSANRNIPLSEGGITTITIKVTAENATTTKTYSIEVTRAASDNAALSNLQLSAGTLSPLFDPHTSSYSASVGNDVASLTVTPTTANENARVTVNGNEVTRGSASDPISLDVGNNTPIRVVVRAQDGTTTQSYSITVTRAAVNASADATLETLSLLPESAGTLEPDFSSTTTSYTASVANDVASLTLTAAATNDKARLLLTVDDKDVESTSSSSANRNIPLSEGGITTITIKVTAENATTTKTYSIEVTRAASDNAALSSLSLLAFSAGSEQRVPLTPEFDPDTQQYRVNVENGVESVRLTPTTHHAKATVKVVVPSWVDGVPVERGSASADIPLSEGETTSISVVVTAQDGTTTQSYNIAVSCAAVTASKDATLSALSLSDLGDFGFDPAITAYEINVANSIASISVNATPYDPSATLSVNDKAVENSSDSTPIDLIEDDETSIRVVVTAENASTKQTYTIKVNRVPKDITKLPSDFAFTSGTLNPDFDPDITKYTLNADESSVRVPEIPNRKGVTVEVRVNDKPLANNREVLLERNTPTIITINLTTDFMTPPLSPAGKLMARAQVSAAEDTTANTYTITVLPPWPMVSGTLEPLTLYAGGKDGSRNGSAAFSADNADEIVWDFASSDPAVASVKPESPGSSTVIVTPVGEGEATITVRVASGTWLSDPASFPVTVRTSAAEQAAIRAALSGQGRVMLGSVTDMIGERFDSGTGGTGTSGSACLSSAAAADGNSGDNGIAVSHGDSSDHLIAGDSWNTDLAATGLHGVPHVGQRGEDSMDKAFDDLLELFRGQPHSLHLADWGLECGSGAAGEVRSRPWTLWAGTDLQWARGGTETSDFDGEWQLYYLGADRAFAEQWLAGISLSRVWGEVDYSFEDATAAGDGQLSSSLTAIYPYLHGQLSSNLELWAIGGFGFGEVENEREHVDGDADQGDLQMQLLSVGLRRSLSQAGSAMDLAFSSDAGFVSLSTEGERSLDGAEASIGRFRLGLELSRPFANGVEPFAQLHGRYDSGDGPGGAAGEMVLGLRYGNERLDLELRGNHLTSAADFEQWGANARLDYGPATDGTGLNLALTSQWGAAENGDSFLDGHSMELPTPALVSAQGDGGSAPAEISGEIGYSLSMGQQWGSLTPNLGYDHSGNGSSRSRVGLAYALSSDLGRDIELRLDLARRERRQEDPDHSIELGASLRF